MADSAPVVDAEEFKTNFSLIQNVYGIFLVLGFRELAASLYSFCVGESSEHFISLSLVGVSLATAVKIEGLGNLVI